MLTWKFPLFLIVGAVFGLACPSLAQKKAVDPREFDQVRSKGMSSIYSGPRRTESATEVYANGEVVKSDYFLFEFASDDQSRSVRKRLENRKTFESETIRIGHFEYTRVDQSPWSKVDLRTLGTGAQGSGSGSGYATCSVRQLTVEDTFLGSVPTRLFEKLEIREGREGIVLEETRIWIGADGTLLQEEVLSSSFEPRALNSKRWAKYEANPVLRIEAPIQ